MESVNNHIKQYLDYYCNLEIPPGYAILLNGEWGSGKTWFIKNYQKNNNNFKILYVSLYGISELSEIEYAFFQQLHPILSSKGMVLFGRFMKGVLRGTLKIDLNNDGSSDGNFAVSVPDLEISKHLSDPSKCILVFDDLERCVLDITLVLGYINYFVEQKDMKVILIADEEKLLTNENEKFYSYQDIKEKLVGRTFSVTHAIDDVLSNFVDEIYKGNNIRLNEKNISILKNIYLESECKNLRILKQIILDFSRIYEILPKKVKDNQTALEVLIKILAFLSIELKMGSISSQEIFMIISESSQLYYLSLQNNDDNTDKKLSAWISKIFSRYSFLKSDDLFPNSRWWKDFFDKGLINLSELNESIISSKYFNDKNTPDWIKLWHYSELSDDEFPILIKVVANKLWENRYPDIGVICHVVGLLLYFSRVELYELKRSEILERSKQCIKYMSRNNLLDFTLFENIYYDLGSYQNLAIYERESNDYIDFKQYVSELHSLFLRNSMQDTAHKMLESMKEDVWNFIAVICSDILIYKDKSTVSYYDDPILKFIDPQIFVNNLLNIKSTDQILIFESIQSRYKIKKTKLQDELEWLQNVQKLLKDEAKNRLGTISGHTLSERIERYLDPTIKKLQDYFK